MRTGDAVDMNSFVGVGGMQGSCGEFLVFIVYNLVFSGCKFCFFFFFCSTFMLVLVYRCELTKN